LKRLPQAPLSTIQFILDLSGSAEVDDIVAIMTDIMHRHLLTTWVLYVVAMQQTFRCQGYITTCQQSGIPVTLTLTFEFVPQTEIAPCP
jgi:hypothetical protein